MLPPWPARLSRDRIMKHASRSSCASSRKPAAEGFLEIHFVGFGPDKLYSSGGEGDDQPADRHHSLSGTPVFLFVTYRNAWGDRCDLGEAQEVCRSWIKQVTIFLQSKGLLRRRPAHGANTLLWLLHDCHHQHRGVMKNHQRPSYQTSSWRRLWEFHLELLLGTCRVPLSHCSHTGPPPAMPQLVLVTKVLPSICYHSGFNGSF